MQLYKYTIFMNNQEKYSWIDARVITRNNDLKKLFKEIEIEFGDKEEEQINITITKKAIKEIVI